MERDGTDHHDRQIGGDETKLVQARLRNPNPATEVHDREICRDHQQELAEKETPSSAWAVHPRGSLSLRTAEHRVEEPRDHDRSAPEDESIEPKDPGRDCRDN